jgi:hypothetical protein
MDHSRLPAMRREAPLSSSGYLSGSCVVRFIAKVSSFDWEVVAVGEMRRAMAREEQDRMARMEEERKTQNRFASTLIIVATIIAAVRLARDDISTPSPRLMSAVSDSVQLARMILKRVVGSYQKCRSLRQSEFA